MASGGRIGKTLIILVLICVTMNLVLFYDQPNPKNTSASINTTSSETPTRILNTCEPINGEERVLCRYFNASLYQSLEPLPKECVTRSTIANQVSRGPIRYRYFDCEGIERRFDTPTKRTPNDTDVVFMHNPKAAGSSFISMIGVDHCCKEGKEDPMCQKIWMRASWPICCKRLTDGFHQDIGVISKKTPKEINGMPSYLSIFRHPRARFASHFDQFYGKMKTIDFDQFLRGSTGLPNFNKQAHHLLVGGVHSKNEWMDLLKVERLDKVYIIFNEYPEFFIGIIEELLATQFAWVGSVDDSLWLPSVELFKYQFNMDLPDSPSGNVRKVPTIPTEEQKKIISENSKLDALLSDLMAQRVRTHTSIMNRLRGDTL